MFFPVDDITRREAKTPHELAMVNLIVFNLLIGVVPLLIAVMVTIMLGSGAFYQAGRGELPDTLVVRFAPPEGLAGSETEAAEA